MSHNQVISQQQNGVHNHQVKIFPTYVTINETQNYRNRNWAAGATCGSLYEKVYLTIYQMVHLK